MADEQSERIRNLALSGGLSGLVLGGASAALGPFRKWSDLAKAAGIGAAGGGSLAAGSGYVGDELLGDPEFTESNPYTKRTALGGVTVGGTAGGLAGAALGTGLAGGLAKKVLPDNLVTRKLLEYASKGSLPKMGKLGLIGAGVGALGAGYLGADEGMQMDVIENERRRKLLEELGMGAR
jgi:hypothetical protein